MLMRRLLKSSRLRSAALGALLAALTWFLGLSFGVPEILGITRTPHGTVLALALGALLGMIGFVNWIAVIDLVLVAVFCVVALTSLVQPQLHAWIRDDAPRALPAAAIVVLSHGVRTDSTLDGDGVDRLLSGLELLRAGRAPIVVTTRVRTLAPAGWVTSDTDQQRLLALAGAEAQWIVVDSALTTRTEATRTAARLLPLGFRSVIVVTSPMHTRRACAVFEAVGFDVTCVAARTRSGAVRNPVTPADRIAAFREYLYERAGTAWYRERGWIP